MKRDANPEKGLEALDQCEYMVLAMTDGEGKPYCIPLNGVRAGGEDLFPLRKGRGEGGLSADPSAGLPDRGGTPAGDPGHL